MSSAFIRNNLATPSPDQSWWKGGNPDQWDWWRRRLNAMPYADGNFQDDIRRRPNALGTETLDFDRNAILPEWLGNRQY